MTQWNRARTAIVLSLVAAFIVAAWVLRDATFVTPAFWMATVAEHPRTAPWIFAAAYAVAVTLFLPTLPLNLAAGALWGPAFGTLVSAVGSITGAISSFFLARAAVVAPSPPADHQGRLAWLQAKLDAHGWQPWKVVAFVRLNPIFPGPVNFLFGLTTIPARTYCWATAVFLLPPTTAFATIGNSAGVLALEGQVENLRRVLPAAGTAVLFLVLAAVVLRRHVTRSESAR